MSIRVVIADDAPFIREVLTALLVADGIEVVGEAKDGNEVLPVVNSTNPDVILMDIVMPHKSGIEATIEVLEHHPDVKVIACSTLDQNTMVNKAIEAGCVDYVVKPFEKEKIISAIRTATGG